MPAAGSGSASPIPAASEDDRDDSDAGAMPAPPDFVAAGEPLEGSVGRWTFIEFPDTQCRDGSPAGLYLNSGTANKLMIFLEGGGRCANRETCSQLNAANLAEGEFLRVIAGGILDRTRSENPVRDWHFAYVPYCTGDRHGGANPGADVPEVGVQKLVGYTNLEKLLHRIVPTFRGVSDVLLTGVSAGGFGVAYTAPLVQRAFAQLKIKIIIDGAPFASTAVFMPCDQELTRRLYRADETFLSECGAACADRRDWWLDYATYFATSFADRPTGLISTTEDLVERALFGIGADDCTGALDLLNPPITAATFRADQLALRTTLGAFPSFSTFYPDEATHTFLIFDAFYTVRAGDVSLVDWFTQIVNGEVPGHAGP